MSGKHRTALAVVVLSVLSLFVPNGRASAAGTDRLVNPATGVDSGNCTVTKCKTITYAHGQAVAGDRLVLDAGNYTETPKPVITKAITIQGAGQATTLIGTVAPSAGIALTINVGALNAVTIAGVTIRNGVGGLFLQTGSAIVNDSTVTNNTGTTSGAGVIVNLAASAPSITLNNVVVSNNTANRGAGIFSAGGRIVMSGGQVVNNTTNAVAGNVNTGSGGGIYSTAPGAPGLSLTNVTVSGNKANAAGAGATAVQSFGGGIFTNGTAVITGGSITNNQANPLAAVAGNGGGVYNAGTAALQSTITGNAATVGGGLYNAAQMTITNSSIGTNAANSSGAVAGGGGGIFNTGTATATGNLTIDGTTITDNTARNGAGIMNFSAFATGGVVTLTGGKVANNTVTALTPNTATGKGGGLYSAVLPAAPKPAMSLSGVEVSGNKAVGAGTVPGTGGGMYNFTGTDASITNASTFSNNSATNGGALYNEGAAALDASPVTGNTATVFGTAAGNGGGIYNALGTLAVTAGTITSNAANAAGNSASVGGGVYNTGTATISALVKQNAATFGAGVFNSGTSNISNSTIEANPATAAGTTPSGGGGLFNGGSGTATLTGTTVKLNTANNGAGIENLSFSNPGSTVNVSGGAVTDNTTTAIANNANTGNGGGIYNASLNTGSLKVTNAEITGNKALGATGSPGKGGGISNATLADISGTLLRGNNGVNGGAVYNVGTATIGGGTMTANTAVNGGGLYNTGTETVAGVAKLTDMVVSANIANNGGGLLNFSNLTAGSTLSVSGGEVKDNTANALSPFGFTGFGGGVYNVSNGSPSLSLSDVDVTGNDAVATADVVGTGGGVYNASIAELVDGTTVTDNTASNGGGVYDAGPLTVKESDVSSNDAIPASGLTSGIGGGIYVVGNNNPATNTGSLSTTDSTITENTAADGGGIFNTQGVVNVQGGAVSDNIVTAVAGATTTGFGGGIYSLSGINPGLVLSGTTVERNKALTGGTGNTTVLGNGGGILNFSFAQISSPSFKDNSATGSGGAIYNFAGTIDVTSTPFTGNYAAFFGGTIFDDATSANDVPSTTLVDSPITGTGQLTFVGGGVAVGDHALLDATGGSITGSKAVSAGGLYVQEGGRATLDHTDVTGNTADGGVGGGVLNSGATSVNDAEISDNAAIPNPDNPSQTGLGGGVYNSSNSAPTVPSVELLRVTAAGNDANLGSGVYSTGPLDVRTSTLTENAASGFGVIVSTGPVTLVHDTINRNTGANDAGGLAQFGAANSIKTAGTVVAHNGVTNCFGQIDDGGYNATDHAGTGACPFTENAVIGDPRLGPLADNGGPTRTELPQNNSPLVNKIPVDAPVTWADDTSTTLCPTGGVDQRGIALPQGSKCDIGSTELTGIVAPTLDGPDHALFITGTPNSVGFTYSGVPQPTVSISGDALPQGVTFVDNEDGTATLAGTAAPGTAGTYHFTVTATNGEGEDATIPFTLVVIEPLQITTNTLPEGTPQVPYNATLQATGGTTPYTWTLESGSLPPGLTLNPNGTITGTPTTRGQSTFTVRVTDSTDPAQTTMKQLSILVRSNTALKAEPAVVKVALPSLRISIIRLEARLTELPGGAPLAGQTIVFKAGAQEVCTAITNTNGVARCDNVSTVGVTLPVLLSLGYDAYFNGTQTLRPSQAHGALVAL